MLQLHTLPMKNNSTVLLLPLHQMPLHELSFHSTHTHTHTHTHTYTHTHTHTHTHTSYHNNKRGVFALYRLYGALISAFQSLNKINALLALNRTHNHFQAMPNAYNDNSTSLSFTINIPITIYGDPTFAPATIIAPFDDISDNEELE